MEKKNLIISVAGEANSGKNIVFGDCEKDDKVWAVQDMWRTEREFKTLKGAIKFANC